MRAAWAISCTLGETAGIAGVAILFAAAARGLLPAPPAILGSGVWEGLCLGTAQALVLMRLRVPPLRWVAVTMLVATLGYAGSLAFGAGDTGAAGAAATAEPPLGLMLAAFAAMGAGLGLLMGAAQAFVAGRALPFWPWVAANAVGWTPAMVAITFPATQVTLETPLATVALIGAATGAVAGLCVGLATLLCLPHPQGATS